MTEVKLNLGCGENIKEGYINVDKYGKPDVKHDLEVFPWPWKDSSVDEILFNHSLECLGQDVESYIKVIQEIYRISKDQALVYIATAHPRHDHFLNDPTRIRAITPDGMRLFSKEHNEIWIEEGLANSLLAIRADVDLELIQVSMTPDDTWRELIESGEITTEELFSSMEKKYNNVVRETIMTLKVLK